MLVERQFYLELPLPHSELACEMPSGVGEVVQKHLAGMPRHGIALDFL